jgi:hypothetical protein
MGAIDIDYTKWFLSQIYKEGRVVYVNLSSHLKKHVKALFETLWSEKPEPMYRFKLSIYIYIDIYCYIYIDIDILDLYIGPGF